MKKQLLNDIKISRMDSIERELVLFLTNPNLKIYSDKSHSISYVYLILDKNNYMSISFVFTDIYLNVNIHEVSKIIDNEIDSLIKVDLYNDLKIHCSKYLEVKFKEMNLYQIPLQDSFLKNTVGFRFKREKLKEFVKTKFEIEL